MATSFRPLFAMLIAAAATGTVPAFAATAAKASTFDLTTYTIPDGFELLPGGENHANFRRVDPGNWILFGVYGSKVSLGDLSREFAADWQDLSGAPTVAVPASRNRTVGPRIAAVEGGADCPGIGYVDLIDIDAGGKVVSIIIETGNAEGFSKTYRKLIEAFLANVVVRPTAAGAPAAAAAATSAPEASPQIRADASRLAGAWESGRTVGAMTITSALDIDADGSYHWVTESGGVVGGRAFANKSRDERGTVSLAGRSATFRAADGTAKSYTFNVIAGNPLAAFSLENDKFTRR